MNTVLCPYNAVLHIRIEFTFAGSSITARIRSQSFFTCLLKIFYKICYRNGGERRRHVLKKTNNLILLDLKIIIIILRRFVQGGTVIEIHLH